MKTFRELMNLVEACGVISPYEGTGSLWHGTDLLALSWIISSNRMSPSIDNDHPDFRGVSLTVNERMAWDFADRSSYIFSVNHCHAIDEMPGKPPVPTRGAVIQFSTEKLKAKFKLANYVDDANDDEEEVRVMCSGISPVLPFVTGFTFNPDDLAWFLTYCDTKDCANDHQDVESLKRGLLALPRHRLFRQS